MAEGSAGVALELEIALRDDRRATFRSLEELEAWTGASPAGPLEGLLPIEGGERCWDRVFAGSRVKELNYVTAVEWRKTFPMPAQSQKLAGEINFKSIDVLTSFVTSTSRTDDAASSIRK